MDRVAWAVGMTTCPRERKTIDASVKSIHKAGWNRVHIYDDADKQLGSYGNFKRALENLLTIGADRYVVFQDDVEVAAGLREHLESDIEFDRITQHSITSLYCAGPQHHEGGGWNPLLPKAGEYMYGALAIVMGEGTARTFLASHTNQGTLTGTDVSITRFCEKNSIPIWLPSPSFVRHTGDTSTIHDPILEKLHGRFRNCSHFCPDASRWQRRLDSVAD